MIALVSVSTTITDVAGTVLARPEVVLAGRPVFGSDAVESDMVEVVRSSAGADEDVALMSLAGIDEVVSSFTGMVVDVVLMSLVGTNEEDVLSLAETDGTDMLSLADVVEDVALKSLAGTDELDVMSLTDAVVDDAGIQIVVSFCADNAVVLA